MVLCRAMVAVPCVGFVLQFGCSIQKDAVRSDRVVERAGEFEFHVEQWGPDGAMVERAIARLFKHPVLRDSLAGTQHRLLTFQIIEDERKAEGRGRPPTAFEAVIYDYTNKRALIAVGDVRRPRLLELTQWNFQPPPTPEEFQEAVAIITANERWGPLIKAGALEPYPAMPGVLEEDSPDGIRDRILTVGLMPRPGARPIGDDRPLVHDVIGVSLGLRELRKLDAARLGALFDRETCEPPASAGQPTTTNTSGAVNVRVVQSGWTIWEFRVVRPAASSGTRGSGVELRDVRYKGVKVLHRGHVPILNVQYHNNACGPFRDWQNEENRFEAVGTDVAPGFRLCSAPARTIMESGSDHGNFAGVAIWVEGQEVVLASEMSAGWYRYISKWRLHTDGTIKPQFGFAAVQNSCTCRAHVHHCYWRLDLDVAGAGNDRIDEFNNPPLVGTSNWHAKNYETKRPRNPASQRRWKVSDVSGRSYTVIPGPNDGTADVYGRGDQWFLRYHSGEIDDGHNSTGSNTEADIDKFVNFEHIVDKDVVVWYAGHFVHDPSHSHAQLLGPTLTPGGW